MSKKAFDIVEQTFPELYNITINSHGRTLNSIVGRKLIDYVGLHMGYIKKHNFIDAFFTSIKLAYLPKQAPKLLCINISDSEDNNIREAFYNFLDAAFPVKLTCEIAATM
jgi:hypothetical protein